MNDDDAMEELLGYLHNARRAVLWKLEGLSDYDVRRPMVPSGSNLLGLVKHLAGIEIGYFGPTFDRPYPVSYEWLARDAAQNADFWATPEESRADIIAIYRRAWSHADETIDALSLGSIGRVWWDPERSTITLHQVMVHVLAETNRHLGHMDILRELIDGSTGYAPGRALLPAGDGQWWREYRATVEDAAAAFLPHPGATR